MYLFNGNISHTPTRTESPPPSLLLRRVPGEGMGGCPVGLDRGLRRVTAVRFWDGMVAGATVASRGIGFYLTFATDSEL